MSCSHRGGCPLFPFLNASLRGWREVYCDTEAAWGDCARYRLSARGEPVPLALLPNGRMPIALARSMEGDGPDAGRGDGTSAGHGEPPIPVPSPPTAEGFPGAQHAQHVHYGQYGQHGQYGQYGQHAPAAAPARPPRQDPGAWGRAWARLVAWMRAPA